MSGKSVCAITVPFPGAKRPLEEGKKLGWWNLHMLDGKPKNLLCIPEAEVYLFGAFHPIYAEIIPLLKAEKKDVVILWTSSIGEVDFCPPEQAYLPILLRDPDINQIWFGDEGFARAYSDRGFYAAYPLAVDDTLMQQNPEKRDILTLFCPTGPKKNILTQLMAVKIVQEDVPHLVLHTNIEGYDWVLQEINHVRHGWLGKSEYEKLIGSARLNLAVSHCETFNYQVAEALILGTVSVCSATVPLPGFRVEDPSNAHEIASWIYKALWRLGSFPEVYPKDLQDDIIRLAKQHNAATLKTLESRL